MVLGLLVSLLGAAKTHAQCVVISQIYSRYSAGATYDRSFVELFNRTGEPVDLTNWSLQSRVFGTWTSTPLRGVVPPHRYFLVAVSYPDSGQFVLPTPDVAGELSVGLTGTLALVAKPARLTGSCPAAGTQGVVQIVGYGPASAINCFEGSAPTGVALTTTTAILRRGDGCFADRDNFADFVLGTPLPRNSSVVGPACASSPPDLFLNVIGPTSCHVGYPATVIVDVTNLGCAPASNCVVVMSIPAGYVSVNSTPSGTLADAQLTILLGHLAPGARSRVTVFMTPMALGDSTTALAVSTTDAETGPPDNNLSSASLTSYPPASDYPVKISQILPTSDGFYVELFNPTGNAVALDGTRLGYRSGSSSSSFVLNPITVLPQGRVLVRLAKVPALAPPLGLPQADVVATYGLTGVPSNSFTVALMSGPAALLGNCESTSAGMIDLVGWGTSGTCAELSPAAWSVFPSTSPPPGVVRREDGCRDSGNNSADFVIRPPGLMNQSTIVPCGTGADASVWLTSAPTRASIGDVLTYSGSAALVRSSPVSGAVLTVQLADTVDFISSSPAGTYDWTTRTLSIAFDALPTARSWSVRVMPRAAGPSTISWGLSQNEPDIVPYNNYGSHSVPVQYAPASTSGFATTRMGTGLPNGATCMALAPDGRIFVAIKSGALYVVNPNGVLQTSPVHQFVVQNDGERGFLGLTLAPDFATSGRIYAYVSRQSPTRSEIVSIQLTNLVASPAVSTGAEAVLVTFDNNSFGHQGGQLRFGPDGKLYIGLGDSGISNNAQSLANRLGKILRYNADGSIPADNPTSFAGVAGTTAGANRAIWAIGLRNPFTFAFQSGSGRLLVNDVGELLWEEVNEVVRGRNYGWPTTEGDFNQTTYSSFTRPVFAYSHTLGTPTGSVIAGAAFYNSAGHDFPPGFAGSYFFGDYSGSWLYRMDPSGVASQFTNLSYQSLVALEVDPQGRLLVLQGGYSTTVLTRISFGRCTLADVTGIGGPPAISDKQLTIDDIIAFVNSYSDGVGCPGIPNVPCTTADLCGPDGPGSQPDGQLSVDDIVAFISAYVEGC